MDAPTHLFILFMLLFFLGVRGVVQTLVGYKFLTICDIAICVCCLNFLLELFLFIIVKRLVGCKFLTVCHIAICLCLNFLLRHLLFNCYVWRLWTWGYSFRHCVVGICSVAGTCCWTSMSLFSPYSFWVLESWRVGQLLV